MTFGSTTARAGRIRHPAPPGSRGIDLEYLKQLLACGAAGFDWRAQERAVTAANQFRDELGAALEKLRISLRFEP